jgi:hypothetical protein
MTEPERLYTAKEIADELGERQSWVHAQMKKVDVGVPRPSFIAKIHGNNLTLLWPATMMGHWRAYHASRNTVKRLADKYSTYSDHRAVNRVGSLAITWKLWWRTSYDGGTMWWFSTPQGWYTSTDDGQTWEATNLMVRPSDYRYFSVNGNAEPSPAVAAILHAVAGIRLGMEK